MNQAELAARYKALWTAIRSTSDPVTVRCPVAVQARLINRIQKHKCRVNMARKSVGLPSLGKLVIQRNGDVLTFSLPENGELF